MSIANSCDVAALIRSRARWRAACITGLAAVGIVAMAGLQAPTPKRLVGISGGDSYIYRVYDDGSIDFIQADNQIKSSKGIPTWQSIAIDENLRRRER